MAALNDTEQMLAAAGDALVSVEAVATPLNIPFIRSHPVFFPYNTIEIIIRISLFVLPGQAFGSNPIMRLFGVSRCQSAPDQPQCQSTHTTIAAPVHISSQAFLRHETVSTPLNIRSHYLAAHLVMLNDKSLDFATLSHSLCKWTVYRSRNATRPGDQATMGPATRLASLPQPRCRSRPSNRRRCVPLILTHIHTHTHTHTHTLLALSDCLRVHQRRGVDRRCTGRHLTSWNHRRLCLHR